MGKTLIKRLTSLFLGLIIIIPALLAQDSSTVYVIRELNFEVDGRSLPYYLSLYGEIREGERIQGRENHEIYIERRIENLNNQRVLDETATRIDYFLGPPEPDAAIPVRLEIFVKDTPWNLIILPYPKYDSNDGLSISLRAREYNFLGTMNPLRVDLGFASNQDDQQSVNFMIDTNTPFRAFGFDWVFNFDHYIDLTFGEDLYYRNVTGVSMNYPWNNTNFNFGINHLLTFNHSDYKDPYGSIEPYASWAIPLGINVGEYGQLSYTLALAGSISYPYGLLPESFRPTATFSHSLGFGRVNWIGNYRKGLNASLSNSFTWHFDRSDAPLAADLLASVHFYHPFNNIIAIYSRLRYRHFWQWSDRNNRWIAFESGGSDIRGVINREIHGYNMLSFNLDIPIRILRFWPTDWLEDPEMRLFNFEMHFSPFVDIALVEGPYYANSKTELGDIKFSLDNMITTIGFEIIVYPDIARSLQIRASFGYNIEKLRDRGYQPRLGFIPQWDEIFIGMDFHF